MKACVVSGSFDPITNGHMDLIRRAKEIFDTVYVVMLINPEKSYCFTKEQRLIMLKAAVKDVAIADFYDGYTVDYCSSHKVKHIVRGIRGVDSYKYEYKIDQINKSINPKVSTIYFPANEEYKDISSTVIRKKLENNEDISCCVPYAIIDLIGEYYGKH